MFGLKGAYFYLIALQVTFIKFFKKVYFSSNRYNNSLKSKIPTQVFFNPNPFLLSIISPYKKSSFKINDINPNDFWLENKKDKITKKISFLSCVIDFEKKKFLQIILDNGDPENSHYSEYFAANSIISEDLFNKDELFKFIGKKSFDNRSDFQYYPFKLFQGVLINE